MARLLHADLTYKIRGLAINIHNQLHGGHEESTYETALAYAMEDSKVPFLRQPVYRIEYRGKQVGEYRPDFAVGEGRVLLELKALPAIGPLEKAQTISYLAVTGAELALIMNFGGISMQFERIPNFLGRSMVGEQATFPLDRDNLLYSELSQKLLDALGHVRKTLGPGFLHQIYRRAARIELDYREIDFSYIKELPLRYDGHIIKMAPVRLLLVENRLLVATVALQTISTKEIERLRWAMKMTDARLGMIANFYGTTLKPQFIRDASGA